MKLYATREICISIYIFRKFQKRPIFGLFRHLLINRSHLIISLFYLVACAKGDCMSTTGASSAVPSRSSIITSHINIRMSFYRVRDAFQAEQVEEGKGFFREFSRQLSGNHPSVEEHVFKPLWLLKEEPEGDPIELGRRLFYDEGCSSTLYLKSKVLKDYSALLFASLDQLPPSLALCPASIKDRPVTSNECGDNDPCSNYRPGWFDNKTYHHLFAPNGQYVHVFTETCSPTDYSSEAGSGGCYHGGDEYMGHSFLFSEHQPLTDGCSGLRPIAHKDYASFGYNKIGRFWVDPENRSDVARATEKTRIDNQPITEKLGTVVKAIASVFGGGDS